MMEKEIKIQTKHLWFYYHGRTILENIQVEIEKNVITSLIGPSGQGKSTFLMTLNRLWENIDGARAKGSVDINFGNGFEDIYTVPVSRLRRQVGMVFQVPNPLPMSIFKNVAFPLRLMGEKDQIRIAQKVRDALERTFLWGEVKDRLSEDARTLSGGQQQRLCMARALILEPQVLLLDEPTSSLDETSGRVIEDLLLDLKRTCTIVLVSHYMDQVKRIADNGLVLTDRQLKQH
ncbi:ATP-binding cassette domain-containing protein [Desulfobacula sp.]|uniref:phosphate ABC transporter ATP-binding protein n=1 Tax=Desulfobacula sp. TaxID=2593537 RepID=UPI00261798B7|nr:ATP-binding cassette domain-containing protein [Desulfobacula sp.]